jgi:hypothetical protein
MNDNNKPKRQRFSKQYLKNNVAENRQISNRNKKVDLNSIDASKKGDRKRNCKNTSGDSSKKQKTEAPSSSRNAEVLSSVVNDHSEDKEATTKSSKHYEEQKKLLSDWDLMKEILIARYYMSFATEAEADLVEAEVDLVKAEADLVEAEADLVEAEADSVEAEAEIASLKVKTYVDPRVTEAKHLSPCGKCEMFSAKVKVYFLNSKISGIIVYQCEQITVY